MRNIRHDPRQAGFTLIELLVVIAIIAVLGLASDQTASLNVVFIPAVQSQAGVSVPAVQQCAVNLAILDRAGTVLASSTEILSPNQSRSLIYPPVGKDPTAVEQAERRLRRCPGCKSRLLNKIRCAIDFGLWYRLALGFSHLGRRCGSYPCTYTRTQ